MLLALQLTIGRHEMWLPSRWRNLRFDGDKRERFIIRLINAIRWCERWSRPRGGVVFGHRLTNVVFGVLVLGGTVAAFLAPPFSMLDTLPALGVVVVSLGVLSRPGFDGDLEARMLSWQKGIPSHGSTEEVP